MTEWWKMVLRSSDIELRSLLALLTILSTINICELIYIQLIWLFVLPTFLSHKCNSIDFLRMKQYSITQKDLLMSVTVSARRTNFCIHVHTQNHTRLYWMQSTSLQLWVCCSLGWCECWVEPLKVGVRVRLIEIFFC